MGSYSAQGGQPVSSQPTAGPSSSAVRDGSTDQAASAAAWSADSISMTSPGRRPADTRRSTTHAWSAW
jgi:hypothetical protein